MTPTVRPETPADRDAVHRVNRLAFGQEAEAALVDALGQGGYSRVSLVAEIGGEVVGHILFSELPILTGSGTVRALALAPMAVLPEYQRRGIGSALVRRGLAACRDAGYRVVVVLGHAGYYPRFGFSTKLAQALSSPLAVGDAWMAAELVPGALEGVRGWVQYSPPFAIGPFVRPAYPSDRTDWLRMRCALWPEETDGQHVAEFEAYFAGRFPNPPGLFLASAAFVAVRPIGGLCGFAEASIRSYAEDCETTRVGYVEGWFVDPDARRKRIGRMLLAAAEAWAIEQGCTEMASDAHLENAVSREAHRALGYAESSRLVHFRKPLTRAAGAS
jgi:putative acetyltransferase